MSIEYAAKLAATAALAMLRKSQMSFDYSAPHHVAYDRRNASGTVSHIQAKNPHSATPALPPQPKQEVKAMEKPTIDNMAKMIGAGNFDVNDDNVEFGKCDSCGKERDVKPVHDADNAGGTMYGDVCDDCIDAAYKKATTAPKPEVKKIGKQEVEVSRRNVTVAEFFAAIKGACKNKGMECNVERQEFENPTHISNDSYFVRDGVKHARYGDGEPHRQYDGSDAAAKAETSRTKPYDYQTYILNHDGSAYNEICEFTFTDEKRGSGYYYQLNKPTPEQL